MVSYDIYIYKPYNIVTLIPFYWNLFKLLPGIVYNVKKN